MTAPLLLSIFPSFAVGGAQSRFATIANHLGPSWRHAIVAMDGVTTASERLSSGLDVCFPDVKVEKGKLVRNVRRFRGTLRALQPTTLLTHNFGSIEWAISNRPAITRHIHVEDGFGPDERAVQKARRIWLRRIWLRGRPVVLPSKTLMNIAQQTWQLDTSFLHYVPNGIDLDHFASSYANRTWPGDGPVIGTIAALRPEKNIARLIRAFGLLVSRRPARLVLVGDGAQRTELEALTDDLGLQTRVFFEGHVAHPAGILKSFDIFAMSSDTEQMPISLLEAMAAGLPAAATDVGDIRSMLPDAGWPFVVACDDAALAKALLDLVETCDREKLGRANRDRAVQNYSQISMFKRWSDLLEGRLSKAHS